MTVELDILSKMERAQTHMVFIVVPRFNITTLITMIETFILELWSLIKDMSPYLLLGFLIAGILSVGISPAFVEKNLGGKGFFPILKASLFGIPLPLCSCGVIPVATSLYKNGANKSATTSFLISTPQTGADSILVTYSLLGPIFAIFRPLAALFAGILGGFAVWFLWIEAAPIALFLINLFTSGLSETHELKVHLVESIPYFRYLMMGMGLLLIMRYRPKGILPEKIEIK